MSSLRLCIRRIWGDSGRVPMGIKQEDTRAYISKKRLRIQKNIPYSAIFVTHTTSKMTDIPRLMIRKFPLSVSVRNGSVPAPAKVVFPPARVTTLLVETPGLRAENKAAGVRRARTLTLHTHG